MGAPNVALLSCKVWRTLFEEGGYAFARVVGVEERPEVKRFGLERGSGPRLLQAFVDRAFHGGDRKGRFGSDQFCDALRLGAQAVFRSDALNQAAAQRFL